MKRATGKFNRDGYIMDAKANKTIEQIVQEDGRYPLEAVDFVREGLSFTVKMVFNNQNEQLQQGMPDEDSTEAFRQKPVQQPRHVSGQQLCHGLRMLAQQRWGLMARSVLQGWNITSTRDFGEIVYLLVSNGWMQKQPSDSIDDFSNVYDFVDVFDREYQITL